MLPPSSQRSILDFPGTHQNCSTSDRTSKHLTPLPFILYNRLPLQIFLPASPITLTLPFYMMLPFPNPSIFHFSDNPLVFSSFLLHPSTVLANDLNSLALSYTPTQPNPKPRSFYLSTPLFLSPGYSTPRRNHPSTKADVLTDSWSPFSRGLRSSPETCSALHPDFSKAI